MKLQELLAKVKHETLMMTAHEQSIQGCTLLYSAALLCSNTPEADRLRGQIHDLMDLALDCRSRISYYTRQDVTD